MKNTFKYYVFIPALIGAVTGFFAILFVYAIEFFSEIFLKGIIGFFPPMPAGENKTEFFTVEPQRPYLLPLITALGGFITGWLAYKFSPESAGLGLDAAVRAYHRSEKLSFKDAVVKLIASSITIGTGGTSGKLGPVALIGASLGYTLGELLKFNEKKKREALAIGLGAGIAAIFKAPLAGAMISAEIFFKRDFVMEHVIPGFVASTVSYSVYALHFGFQPVFQVDVPPFKEEHVSTLLAYVGLGLITALAVRVYLAIYYTISDFFKRLNMPFYLKTAFGGFISGLIGMFIPYAIGNGLGWLQLIMDGKITDYTQILPAIFGVMLGVSFTLGSGMSGGIFGPSILIGGLIGSSYSIFLKEIYGLPLDVTAFTIVGMASFFASALTIPLSTIVVVVEMTGGYELLVPAMITVFISYFLSGERSILPSQVATRFESPAHHDELGLYVLEKFKIKDFMTDKVVTVSPDTPLEEVHSLLSQNSIGGIPVVNGNKLVGIVTKSDILGIPKELRGKFKAKDVMSKDPIILTSEHTLYDALRIMTVDGVGRIPIVNSYEDRILVGIIARADIGKAIRKIKKDFKAPPPRSGGN